MVSFRYCDYDTEYGLRFCLDSKWNKQTQFQAIRNSDGQYRFYNLESDVYICRRTEEEYQSDLSFLTWHLINALPRHGLVTVNQTTYEKNPRQCLFDINDPHMQGMFVYSVYV